MDFVSKMKDSLLGDVILYYIIGFILFENFFELYLILRQVNVYKTTRKVPAELKNELTLETFEKARLYGLYKSQFSIVKSILLEVILVPLELYFGILSILWYKSQEIAGYLNLNPEREIQTSCVGFNEGEKPILVGLILIFTYIFGVINYIRNDRVIEEIRISSRCIRTKIGLQR